ncbi:MAG TPA: GTPase HflX [Candidatus Omnitrophota bacterium]|nr:GTPase HflX [Candidatus Omnitrophota bacterium]HPD84181.1 GTPase HflX [Candidatus Omnitrophota bacterium]HRZ03037.1 GTPase HflX [Candidatus Omnitrophota bacterium]
MAERVLLVMVDFNDKKSWPVTDITQEMQELVTACGGEVIDHIVCVCPKPTARFLIGEGKVEEIAALCSVKEIQTAIFSHDLKGSQKRNLEEIIKVKIIDRTQLILDIFARRAKSQEGVMQVELAQLQYLLPRLVGHGIELSRLGGGIGTVGPGETKLEIDRRRIAERITKLRDDLKQVVQSRRVKRKKRKEQEVLTVALVGYTNAGKSTLLNALTDAEQETKDGLFTTLDPLSRQYALPNNRKIVLSDTVGFMHDLPHNLIESFKATLEEVVEADLLLHVLDVSHPRFRQLNDAVLEVLKELNADKKPIITVLNKIDKLTERTWLNDIQGSFPHAVYLSALTKENLPELVDRISGSLIPSTTDINVIIPLNRMDLVNLIHRDGRVDSIAYESDGVHIQATVPVKLAGKIQKL